MWFERRIAAAFEVQSRVFGNQRFGFKSSFPFAKWGDRSSNVNDFIRRIQSTRLTIIVTLLAALSADVLGAQSIRSEDAAAVQVISAFNDTMVSVLKDAEKLGYQGRFNRLRPALENTYDLEFMAEKAIGHFWKDLSQEERAQWRSTFTDFMSANYASRLNNFNNQKFEVVASQGSANGTAIIETKVIEPANDDVQLNYRMRQTAAGWRVIDIYYNGTVSELALRRADYAEVLKKDGFAALIASVNQKIAQMQAGANA
jgi:phospholipid transport system substrate-binding protein